jgi:L-ascorbate metabolism protein UlaG (beta-lactamase superfamily)
MIEITWLGHGTFQFKLASGEVIVLDPWTDGNPSYPADHKFNRIDAILISHGHFDHIHDAVPLAKRFKPQMVCIFETGEWLKSKGVENVSAMNKGGSQKVGPLCTAAGSSMKAKSSMAEKRRATCCGCPMDAAFTFPEIRMSFRIWR